MEITCDLSRNENQRLAEIVVRHVRHDVGDLLQSVYSAAALLGKSLPAESKAEREILASLRNRAVNCKQFLDAIHDLVNPMALTCMPMYLSEAAATLAARAAAQHPHLQIHVEAADLPPIFADCNQITLVGKVLLEQACAAARRHVWFRTSAGQGEGESQWTVSEDGPEVPPEQSETLFSPFCTARPGHAGLWLAYVRKVVIQHGGRIIAGAAPEGGLCLRVVFPSMPPVVGEQESSASERDRP